MNTQNKATLKTKLTELIDAFENLKEYCHYNQIDLVAKCENLQKQAELIKIELEEIEQAATEEIKAKVESLTQQYNTLKDNF